MIYCDYRVIVIAGSAEGMGSVVRLINSLSVAFPVPLVACVHGMRDESISELASRSNDSNPGLKVLSASDGDHLLPGHLYFARAGSDVRFSAPGVLSIKNALKHERNYNSADLLFESAANVYGNAVIGVVLSGDGDDGTRGLLALFHAGGCSVVQSPSDAQFPRMPFNALLGDHVEHLVMLDQMGELLVRLVGHSHK